MITSRDGRWFRRMQDRVRHLKTELVAIGLSLKNPRTPWYAKAVAAIVVAYALSPIDLIPDFIPVLGYLDDLILVPLGIVVAIKLIPTEVLEECRVRAQETNQRGPSILAAVVVVAIWLVLALLVVRWIVRTSTGGD